jgi:hypothetical protein
MAVRASPSSERCLLAPSFGERDAAVESFKAVLWTLYGSDLGLRYRDMLLDLASDTAFAVTSPAVDAGREETVRDRLWLCGVWRCGLWIVDCGLWLVAFRCSCGCDRAHCPDKHVVVALGVAAAVLWCCRAAADSGAVQGTRGRVDAALRAMRRRRRAAGRERGRSRADGSAAAECRARTGFRGETTRGLSRLVRCCAVLQLRGVCGFCLRMRACRLVPVAVVGRCRLVRVRDVRCCNRVSFADVCTCFWASRAILPPSCLPCFPRPLTTLRRNRRSLPRSCHFAPCCRAAAQTCSAGSPASRTPFAATSRCWRQALCNTTDNIGYCKQ